MKAVDYLKAKARMADNCHILCRDCPLKNCSKLEIDYPEQAVEIVERWAKENPIKTYLSVLLEKFPNVKIDKGGFPRICVSELFNTEKYCNDVSINCKDCWNREYKEEVNEKTRLF